MFAGFRQWAPLCTQLLVGNDVSLVDTCHPGLFYKSVAYAPRASIDLVRNKKLDRIAAVDGTASKEAVSFGGGTYFFSYAQDANHHQVLLPGLASDSTKLNIRSN